MATMLLNYNIVNTNWLCIEAILRLPQGDNLFYFLIFSQLVTSVDQDYNVQPFLSYLIQIDGSSPGPWFQLPLFKERLCGL